MGDRKSRMSRNSRNLLSFQDRLTAFSEDARKKASLLPPGLERDAALHKMRQAKTALHLDEWASSPGLVDGGCLKGTIPKFRRGFFVPD